MLVARVLYPVEVLGIGKRIGIWLCGCRHKCDGCANPELWDFDKSKDIHVSDLYDYIRTICGSSQVDGFTVTGGEPFEQYEELGRLVVMLGRLNKDILVYSGYTLEELMKKQESEIKTILGNIAVLIDGRYIKQRNNGVFLRGSDNQTVHILDKSFKDAYTDFLKTGMNKIQNFRSAREIFSIGIHKADFKEDLDKRMGKLGITPDTQARLTAPRE